MTLVIATRRKNRIQFASDSRLTFLPGQFVDCGIKIFEVPVKIIKFKVNPKQNPSYTETIIYDHTWGMAFAGSSTNAYLIKEIALQIFSQLSTSLTLKEVKLDDICQYLLHITKKISDQLIPILQSKGIVKFLISGFCPEAKQTKVFLFEFKLENQLFSPSFEEIDLQEGETLCFGSGNAKANEIGLKTNILRTLKEVIESDDESVGGKMQFGEFNDQNNFEVKRLSETYKDGQQWKSKITVATFDLLKDNMTAYKYKPGHKSRIAFDEEWKEFLKTQNLKK